MKQGFSLVELSIVLVILGLLTGGILAGQSLIRTAEMRATITDYANYAIAHETFRDKYSAMAGDMANATRYWNSAGGNGHDNNCYIAPTTNGATCDGDGDGQIIGTAPEYNERHRYFQQLANAGLITGSYTGTQATYSGYPIAYAPGVNAPTSRLGTGSFWYVTYQAAYLGSTTNFASGGGNMIRITNIITSNFTPEENWNLDTKLDDGKPQYGRMMAYKGDAGYPCTTTFGQPISADANSEFNFSVKTRVCNPWIFL